MALEERGEPGDAAFHGFLVDHVRALEPRERIGVVAVLDLHREQGTRPARLASRSELARERTGLGLARHRVHDPLDRIGCVAGEREHGQHDDDCCTAPTLIATFPRCVSATGTSGHVSDRRNGSLLQGPVVRD